MADDDNKPGDDVLLEMNTDDVSEMVSSWLDAYEPTPQNAYALLRAATVVVKLSGCPREAYLNVTKKMFDRTDVSVVQMVEGSDLPS